jgi:hypothetical protein
MMSGAIGSERVVHVDFGRTGACSGVAQARRRRFGMRIDAGLLRPGAWKLDGLNLGTERWQRYGKTLSADNMGRIS